MLKIRKVNNKNTVQVWTMMKSTTTQIVRIQRNTEIIKISTRLVLNLISLNLLIRDSNSL